jgi:methylated-DNA-[protein]-cysteine S-methyltransferase
MKIDDELKELGRTLEQMRKREKIPASRRRGAIRAQLLEKYSMIQLTTFHTRIGWIGVAYSERGIVALHLPRGSRDESLANLRREFSDATLVDQAPDEIAREMTEYAEGQRRKFDLKLDWSALKPFQRAVLQAANTIPFGETRTYGWVAKQIGKPKASRAVGRALATNPIPIILPCHRVLGSDGGLHGYAGGLPMKAKLLRLEGAVLNL